MKQLTTLVLAVTLATTGCACTIGGGNTIKRSGPRPTIAGGAGLVVLGGALAYKTQSDDMNRYSSDGLVTGIGAGLAAAGVVAIVYGASRLSSESE
ncbi:MAG: hypothetical protein JNL83_15080 [Myxococcales bacterium]|nr:hypothetical protein [Myxococcales bacterium]